MSNKLKCLISKINCSNCVVWIFLKMSPWVFFYVHLVDLDCLPNWYWWHQPSVVIAGIFGTTCFNLRAGEPSTTVRRRPFSAHPGVFFNLRLFKQNKNTAFLSAMPPTLWQKETQSNANIHSELNLRHYLRKRVLWTSNLLYMDEIAQKR